MTPSPVIVVHGGAGSLDSDDDRQQYLTSVGEALERGCAALSRSAHDAVCAAVMHLESHSITNSGRGAALALDGTAALDAGYMDGATRRYGAVSGVRRTENPIVLAQYLAQEGDFGRFVGPPCSDQLVAEAGATPCEPERLISERAQGIHAARLAQAGSSLAPGSAPLLDTVGAVALDAEGHLAAAVSTGGMSLKRPGRIGDSPVVGGGFWADDRVGACVTTGVGEVLMREGTARHAVQLLQAGVAPAEAAAVALAALLDGPDDVRGRSGLILVTAAGEVLLDHNAPEMSSGWMRPDGQRELTHLWRKPS
ncbi:MAG: isoaspartyl peptidase/L-asparaginase [Planctomycetota bacterium]|nr:MAG: isoaspartyl peptidase/L-asparaginase [Planctomycetota bacterium]